MAGASIKKRLEALEASIPRPGVRSWFLLHHRLACGQADAEALTAPGTTPERKRAILAAHGCPDAAAIDPDAIEPMGAGAVLLQPAPGRELETAGPGAQTLTFGPWRFWL